MLGDTIISNIKMKRFRLLAWPLVLCYFGIALTVLAKGSSESDDVRLRVSIRKDTLRGVSSCHHTFSQIELLNLHTTESIMIHSIQTAPEETILIRSVSGEVENSSWENIPQQLHVSRLPSGSLSLGPGQVAIVPVTFLPRYPDLGHDNYIVGSDSKRSPVITSAARADLIDFVGDSVISSFNRQNNIYEPGVPLTKRRSNLEPSSLPAGDEFEVRTSIVVDSSRGVLQVPISASSVRENPYAIPDVIRFHHSSPPPDAETNRPGTNKEASVPSAIIGSDGTVLLNSVTFTYKETTKSSRTRLSRRADPSRDCFDIYVNNPSFDSDLEVSEILISRPDMMSVEFDPAKLLLAPDLLVIPQYPSQAVREWTEEGPMYVPADSVDNYIATVCTAPNGVEEDPIAGSYLEEMSNWIDSGNPEQSLGFLQIRTDSETLFISLERFAERDETKVPGQTESSATASGLPDTLTPEQSSSLLKSTPDELNFRFLSSASPPASASIALQNKSPVPIRIMRVSATLDCRENAKAVENLKGLGLQLNITQGEGERSGQLPAAGSIQNAILVTCRTNPELGSASWNDQSFQFRGSILIRGTMDTELEHEEWKQEMIQDPYRDIHLTLEIPLKISVLNGRVEVTLERSTHPYPQIFGAQSWDRSGRAVSTLFFPLTRFDALDDSEAPLPTQKYLNSRQIGHDLRIMTNMDLPLKLESAEIVDENNLPIDDTDTPCARFNVSRTRQFETDENYPDFEDLGFLTLQYKFDARKERGRRARVQERAAPTRCFLNVVTSPAYTGIHQIPLIVFPAEFEITSPSRLGTRHVGENSAGAIKPIIRRKGHDTVLVGNEELLGWLRSSGVGQSFLEFLESMQEKRSQSDSVLLSTYMRDLLRISDDAELLKVQPILVEIGAIEHGDISKAPLVFTNHNPVPMTLTIDVGEVEGMSIELGRDGGPGEGDASNLFDFLPKYDAVNMESDQTILKEGSFNGHPVLGLRQFLLSNVQGLALSEGFQFRDAVYMSKEAVERQSFLKPLYRWHSYAEFHRNEPVDIAARSRLKACDPSILPPEYQSSLNVHSSTKRQLPSGPFMISGDKKLLRPLKICPNRKSEAADPHKITIPPGGMARFEIKLRSPPLEFLGSDISQLLATGLSLSSNFGQVMPIFATFEALQGQLHLWKSENPSSILDEQPSDIRPRKEDIISVPLKLWWRSPMDNGSGVSDSFSLSNDSRNFDRTPTEEGIPLQIASSFSREIRLLEVESCNPWFHVSLHNSSQGIEVAMGEGTRIGVVQSSAFCLPDQGASPPYPSFFQCILNWLSNRNELQPPGCGSVALSKRRHGNGSGVDVSNRGVRGVIQAFENSMSNSKDTFAVTDFFSQANGTAIDRAFCFQTEGTFAVKSGMKRSYGYIDASTLKTYAEAWDAWEVADEMGLTKISSNLRATIKYKAAASDTAEGSDVAEYQSLSLSMQDLGIQSVLSTPRLFSGQGDAEIPLASQASVLRFPATLVGDVVSMKIPLRNPTSVPVRVRLAAAPLTSKTEPTTSKESLTDRFMQNIDSPYIQAGSGRRTEEQDIHHQWWNGGGAFFLVDEYGDVMQSHHNISIKAGAGAYVSLVNPSLHTISAFVLGCGARCGVRDSVKASENPYDRTHFSTIGAAAAASTILIGRQRSALPQLNEAANDEPFIYAGGTPIPASTGPQAFAIPYASLDEIILPPFGIGEIGPILFRPPGRSLAFGCDVMKQSDASCLGVKVGGLCDAGEFSSMVFLENSLTGLERVELRGQSQWEHLYFLDPPPRSGDSAFGDIEMRNGRDTLVFSGSGNLNDGGKITPAIKQILLHNGGDVSVVVKTVYLSGKSKRMKTHGASAEACRSGSFRLLDCWESSRTVFKVDGDLVENIQTGFELRPGQSRSMHIEHLADCRQREEFVSINVDFTSDSHLGQARSSLVQNTKVDLIVGFAMDPFQFARCTPVNFWNGDFIVVESIPAAKSGINATRQRKLSRGRKPGGGLWFALFAQFIVLSLMVALTSSLVAHLGKIRRQALERSMSKARNHQRDEMKTTSEKKRPSQQNIWNATFRCLARADPTSPELQTLGREQIRQVVAGRYKAKGGSPPSSLANTGVFVRERIGTTTGGIPRQRTGKEGGGTERVRTLSDALFRTFSSEHGDQGRSLIPAGLGWRVAFARGIINDKSIGGSTAAKATTTLWAARSRRNGSDLSTDELGTEHSDSDSEGVDRATEIETQDEEVKIPTSVPSYPNEVPELKETSGFHQTDRSPLPLVASTEEWTKQTKRSQKEPPKHDDASRQNGMKSNLKKPVIETPSVGSPSTSIHSSASSATNDRKNGNRKDRREPSTLEKSSPVGRRTVGARVIHEPIASPRKQKGKKSAKPNEKTVESALKQEPPSQSSHKETWGEGATAATDKKTKLKGKDKKAGEKVETRKERDVPKSKRDKKRSDEKNVKGEMESPVLPPGVCPPPGLAPPPGFNRGGMPSATNSLPSADVAALRVNTGSVESASLEEMLTAALNSDMKLATGSSVSPSLPFSQQVNTPTSDLLFGAGLGESPAATPVGEGGDIGFGIHSTPPIVGTIPTSAETERSGRSDDFRAPPGDPLLDVLLHDRDNSRNGFDVMDFLDGILDDGEANNQQQQGESSATTPSTLLAGSSDVPFTANPWASERKSRAAAYGIAFDDTGEDFGLNASSSANGGSSDGPSLAPFPLLTPAAIFMAAGQNEDGDDDDDRALSFYARLTADEE